MASVLATRRTDGGFDIEQPSGESVRYAFLDVRPCDLRAIAIQARALGASYRKRRDAAFIVAVNCTEPGAVCFCASTGNGPAAGSGADMALTEMDFGFLAEAETAGARAVLTHLPRREATTAEVERARMALQRAGEQMGRSLPEVDLRDLLAGALEWPRWAEIARRWLSSGNCTMVCPTCFCTTVEDTRDLSGDIAERRQRWDSCFDLDFAYVYGAGSVRPDPRSRYRRWLTHKFGTWHDQFGEPGCVGCGRCIPWCPAGVDVTEELGALAS